MENLISITDYKLYKGISSTEQDASIASVIKYVSQQIKTYCNRTFVDHYTTSKALTEKFNGYLNSSVFLSEFPIKEIISAHISEDGGTTTTEIVENTDFFVKADIGEVTTGTGYPFTTYAPIQINSLIIVYTGGYLEIPDDLKLATLDLVHYYITEAYNSNKRLQSASVDTISFTKLGDSAFPPHIKRILDQYRSFSI